MQLSHRLPRVLLFISLLIGLLVGVSAPALVDESASAAPMRASASALDVIISEVAWGGTAANSGHEWIELHNTTSSAITITGWTLVSTTDSSPSITLAGTIPAFGYFLLENGSDSTISNIKADQTYSGGLTNTGEILTLKDNAAPTPNIIDTANSGCSNCWYAGSGSPNYYSMERIGVVADSATAWASNDGVTRNGLDAGIPNGCTPVATCTTPPQPINGTPRNSQIDLALSTKIKSIVGSTVPFTVTFTVTVSNTGYGTATNVKVTDSLSSLLISGALTSPTFVPSVGTYSTGIWLVGSLPTGSIAILDITATMNASGLVPYAAEISASDQLDPDSTVSNGPNSEDDYDSIKIGLPVLDITNIVNNPTPNVGANVVFTIKVSNPNSTDATGVKVDALLPAGLKYVSSTSASYNSSSGIWDIGALANGVTVTLNITATVTSDGLKTYVADVSSIEFGNNSATSSVNPAAGLADLSLTQELSVSTSVAGQVAFKITVNNAGPYDATNVQVKDLLPSGLIYVSDNGSGTYNRTSGIWTVGTLVKSDSKILTINAKVDTSGTMTNLAEIWQADQIDSNSANNSVSVDVKIADLRVAQTVDIGGGNAVFSITVSNAGPDDATGVEITTALPSLTLAYTFASYGSTQGTYISGTGVWIVGTILSGKSATLTITTSTSGSLLVNKAQVTKSGQVDPDSVPNNNIKTEDDYASAPSADLFVTQSVNNVNPDINTNVVFTVTVNNAGAAGTTNVQVKDLLPVGLTYVSHTNTLGTYSGSTGIWIVGPLANGVSQTLSITAKVTANGIKTNWAEVWRSDEADPDSHPGDGSTTEDDDAGATITSYRSIVINEVAWAGTAASPSDEWIELYNPSNASIDITGWTLKSTSGSLALTLSGKIASGGYFLLERDDNFTVSDVAADQVYTASGSLLNLLSDDGEKLTLLDGSSNFIDTANGDDGSWPKGSKSPNYGTMERQGVSAESDEVWATNIGNPRNGKDANNGPIYGTPRKVNTTGQALALTKAAPVPTIPPRVVLVGRPIINEFLPRPGFDWNQDGKVDVFDEFIEIKNVGNANISLSGWVLDTGASQDTTRFPLPAVTLNIGEHMIFYGLQTHILLSDGGGTIRLIHPNGKIYDAYTYSIAKVEDESICRLPDGMFTWYKNCVPTPNLTNTREGVVPSVPGGGIFESPVCDLPDTLPADFLFAECRGYGANIWHSYYWDKFGWLNQYPIYDNKSKWGSFVE